MDGGGWCYYCYYHYSDGPAGCVYMMYADEGSEERPTEADGRLLTSSTTKLSSLLSASLPCERRERQRDSERLDIPALLSDVCTLHAEIHGMHTQTERVCLKRFIKKLLRETAVISYPANRGN